MTMAVLVMKIMAVPVMKKTTVRVMKVMLAPAMRKLALILVWYNLIMSRVL